MDEMFTCGQNVHVWTECSHVDKMFTCGQNVHMWTRCSHVDRMFTCAHQESIKRIVGIYFGSLASCDSCVLVAEERTWGCLVIS